MVKPWLKRFLAANVLQGAVNALAELRGHVTGQQEPFLSVQRRCHEVGRHPVGIKVHAFIGES